MIKACFIYNPRSGFNINNPRVIERTRRFIVEQRASGAMDGRLVSTERPHHATELARAAVAEGCGLVVAVGGDGTVNETATALVNTNATLGLIPCGSGNGLGRHLGIPRADERAFHALSHGVVRTIDTAVADGYPFFNVMGLGFDAEISARFRSLEKRGFLAYVKIIFSEFQKFKLIRCTVCAAGLERKISCEAFIVAVGNSDQYGNNGFITPTARIDDGLLDLTVVRRVSLAGAPVFAARLLTRRLHGSGKITHMRAREFVIERDAPGLIHTDGEPRQASARIEVRVLPASLRVQVPAR